MTNLLLLILMTKLYHIYVYETGIYAEREGESLENIEQENENYACTKKFWHCCCESIFNESLNIIHVYISAVV